MCSDAPMRLLEAEKCFRRACDQIIRLNHVLVGMQRRYNQASKQNLRSFRYAIRVRMAIMEGVRNMYYEYASLKADLITELRIQMQMEDELTDHEVYSDCDSDYVTDDEDTDEYRFNTESDESVTEDTERTITSVHNIYPVNHINDSMDHDGDTAS